MSEADVCRVRDGPDVTPCSLPESKLLITRCCHRQMVSVVGLDVNPQPVDKARREREGCRGGFNKSGLGVVGLHLAHIP